MMNNRAGTTSELVSLQELVNKTRIDQGIQICKLNTQLTSNIAEKTKLAETLTDIKIKVDILNNQNDDINGELETIKRIK